MLPSKRFVYSQSVSCSYLEPTTARGKVADLQRVPPVLEIVLNLRRVLVHPLQHRDHETRTTRNSVRTCCSRILTLLHLTSSNITTGTYPSPELLLHPSYRLAQATSVSLQQIVQPEPSILFSVMEIIEGLMPLPEHSVSVQTLLRFLTVVLCRKHTPKKVLHAADALSVALLAIPIRDVILESLSLSRKIQGVLWRDRENLFRFSRKNLSFRDQRDALMRLCHQYADTSETFERVNTVRRTIRKWMSQLPITLSNLTSIEEEDLQWDNTGWTSTIAHASFSSFLVVLQSLVSVDPTTQIVHREKKDEEEDVPSSPLQVSNSYRPRKGHIDSTIIKSYCECILHLATASSKTSSTSWFASTQPSPRLLKSKSSFIAKFRLSIQDAVSCT